MRLPKLLINVTVSTSIQIRNGERLQRTTLKKS